MDMKKRRDQQLAYIADDAVMKEMAECRKILQKLNFADRSDFDGITETVKDLLGKSGRDCTIIDVARVRIGAGSVVTKDIPDWSIAAGNPCRVIRKITEADRRKLFHKEEIDDEAWDAIYAQEKE